MLAISGLVIKSVERSCRCKVRIVIEVSDAEPLYSWAGLEAEEFFFEVGAPGLATDLATIPIVGMLSVLHVVCLHMWSMTTG